MLRRQQICFFKRSDSGIKQLTKLTLYRYILTANRLSVSMYKPVSAPAYHLIWNCRSELTLSLSDYKTKGELKFINQRKVQEDKQ